MFNYSEDFLYTFISTGDKVAMYTLRMMVRCTTAKGSYLRDDFVRILSNDKDKANNLASQISDDYGIPFKADASFDLNEIKRRKSEEVQAIREEEEQRRIAYQLEIDRQYTERINAGAFVIGKYVCKTAEEVAKDDVGYLFWLKSMHNPENVSKSLIDVNIKIAMDYIDTNGLVPAGHIGEDEQQVQVKLKLVSSFWTNDRFPSIRFVCKTDEGSVVGFKSTAKAFKELNDGDLFEVVGTVKHLTKSNSQALSWINKPKMVKQK